MNAYNYSKKQADFMKSIRIVEDTVYTPSLDTVNRMLGDVKNVGVYDFEDGKDTGYRRGILAQPRPDITEIDKAIEIAKANNKSWEKEVTEKLKEEAKQQKAEAKGEVSAGGNE